MELLVKIFRIKLEADFALEMNGSGGLASRHFIYGACIEFVPVFGLNQVYLAK